MKVRKRVSSQGMRSSDNRVINADDGSKQPQIRIRNNTFMVPPNMSGPNSRSVKRLQPVTTSEEGKEAMVNSAMSPNGDERGSSPAKGSKIRNKYAAIPSKI